MNTVQKHGHETAVLRRSLNLPLLMLYGLGVTIGAGIYVLIGATAARAGIYAPVSFLLAALCVAFTGLSYAELGSRYPVSAGEAAYVRHGFGSPSLSLIVGLMVVTTGIVSSAAISIGAAAYLKAFIPLPTVWLMVMVVVILGLVAAWGIAESVKIAAFFTLIEIGGLVAVVVYGISAKPELVFELSRLVPPFEIGAWSGIASASLLAFFAFVGFEDIANVAEEVKNPEKTLPCAIIFTLIVATLIYLAVVSVVVLFVPLEQLSASDAPLALMFAAEGGAASLAFNVVAAFATINGVLVQMIMASRVLYGLGKQGSIPAVFATVHPVARTPVFATCVVALLILVLALLFPVAALAGMTSRVVLGVFILINLALILLKWRGVVPEGRVFHTSMAIPVLGVLSCAMLFAAGFV